MAISGREKKMKSYIVSYSGAATRFNGDSWDIMANTAREALETIYQRFVDEDYFPQEDGSIRDSYGHEIADATELYISYDGGYFSVEEDNE